MINQALKFSSNKKIAERRVPKIGFKPHKTCIPSSFRKASSDEIQDLPTSIEMFILPCSRFLLGIGDTMLRNIMKKCCNTHSVYAKPRGLAGKTSDESDAYNFEAHLQTENATEDVCNEIAIIP